MVRTSLACTSRGSCELRLRQDLHRNRARVKLITLQPQIWTDQRPPMGPIARCGQEGFFERQDISFLHPTSPALPTITNALVRIWTEWGFLFTLTRERDSVHCKSCLAFRALYFVHISCTACCALPVFWFVQCTFAVHDFFSCNEIVQCTKCILGSKPLCRHG